MATVGRRGRLQSRLVHPLWEGATGWIATGADSLKARHLRSNPYTSLTYWDQTNEQVHVECRAEFEHRPEEKRRVWDLFKDTPFPLGYDPAVFFKEGPEGRVGRDRAARAVARRAVVARRVSWPASRRRSGWHEPRRNVRDAPHWHPRRHRPRHHRSSAHQHAEGDHRRRRGVAERYGYLNRALPPNELRPLPRARRPDAGGRAGSTGAAGAYHGHGVTNASGVCSRSRKNDYAQAHPPPPCRNGTCRLASHSGAGPAQRLVRRRRRTRHLVRRPWPRAVRHAGRYGPPAYYPRARLTTRRRSYVLPAYSAGLLAGLWSQTSPCAGTATSMARASRVHAAALSAAGVTAAGTRRSQTSVAPRPPRSGGASRYAATSGCAAEHLLHARPLHAAPAAVDQPHLVEAGLLGGLEVRLDDRGNLARCERMQVERVLDRNDDRLVAGARHARRPRRESRPPPR